MLERLVESVLNGALGHIDWIGRNITLDVPWSQNYFWGLTLISGLVWACEICFPWRKQQAIFRRDFWQDAFYMYFNFFVVTVVLGLMYNILGFLFDEYELSMDMIALMDLSEWHVAWQLLAFFVLLDFLQWLTHFTLHRVPLFWRFHQVHHSIKEMGFAGHLRYHWMENVLYRPLKILGIMLIGGFEPANAFLVHFASIVIGHLNHANVKWDYGILRYVFNNPVMHLYHHAYELPKDRLFGMNYGISLSVWDYLFKTAYVPENGGQIKIGYPGDEKMPAAFIKQLGHGFKGP